MNHALYQLIGSGIPTVGIRPSSLLWKEKRQGFLHSCTVLEANWTTPSLQLYDHLIGDEEALRPEQDPNPPEPFDD